MESRKAEESDCRVYPQLRQIITCPTVPVPLYDDTAFDNHAKIPIVQFDVNDWPWAARGYSAVLLIFAAFLHYHSSLKLT